MPAPAAAYTMCITGLLDSTDEVFCARQPICSPIDNLVDESGEKVNEEVPVVPERSSADQVRCFNLFARAALEKVRIWTFSSAGKGQPLSATEAPRPCVLDAGAGSLIDQGVESWLPKGVCSAMPCRLRP